MCMFGDRGQKGGGFTPGVKPVQKRDTTLAQAQTLRKKEDKEAQIGYGTEGKKNIEGLDPNRNPASSLAINVPTQPGAGSGGVNTA